MGLEVHEVRRRKGLAAGPAKGDPAVQEAALCWTPISAAHPLFDSAAQLLTETCCEQETSFRLQIPFPCAKLDV